MILLSELITRVRTRYESESGGSSTRFDDDALRLFANEGLETLAEATGFYERYVTVPVEANRTYYDLRGFTPETVVSIKSIWSTTFNDWLKPVAITDLPYDWEQASGDATSFIVRGIHWIGLYPCPSSTAGYLRIYFQGIPARMQHTQYVLGDMPDSYVPALEEYMLYEMAALDRQTELAIRHWKEYAKRQEQIHDQQDMRLVGARPGRFGNFRSVSW